MKKKHEPHGGGKHKPKWSSEQATYCWDIWLDPNHPLNDVEKLRGYSKAIGQSEAQDKDYLLQRKIAMLFRNNYFERMLQIDFFLTNGLNQYEKILELYPRYYNIMELNHDVIWKKHGTWLQSLYERIKTGKGIEDIIPGVKRSVQNKDEFLDPNRREFKDIAQLYTYAAKLSQHGHAPGAVHHFIDTVKRKKGW